jgi:SAM-dependent methyltransferase
MPEDVVRFYAGVDEKPRLGAGYGRLEFARTQEVLRRHLPPPPAVVLDVGGGPGVYSAWLASLGYDVHLVDPVGKHLEQARELSSALASATLGDARRLEFASGSADALLLLGPLYHLPDRADRLAALREAARVTRPKGFVFVAAINRFASLMEGLQRALIDDPQFAALLSRDLEDGQHRNITGNPEYFTTAFFHHPDELQAEISEAGLSIVDVVGAEGPVWLARDFDERWDDPRRREQLLDLARKVEREPTLLGTSQHLLAVARVP